MISSKVALSHWFSVGVPRLHRYVVISGKARQEPSWQFSGSSLFPSDGTSLSCWWSIRGHVVSTLFTLTLHMVYKLWKVGCFKCSLCEVGFTCTVLTLLPHELVLNPMRRRVWSHSLLRPRDSQCMAQQRRCYRVMLVGCPNPSYLEWKHKKSAPHFCKCCHPLSSLQAAQTNPGLIPTSSYFQSPSSSSAEISGPKD